MTATWKTAPCLALGNTAVLKMSELSPLTADQLGMLALEAGIPPGVLNVVQGYGADAGDALVRHPGVRAISFTGGTVTGKKILASAGGVKKYSMELGGKSPVLVFDDADVERALDAAVHHLLAQRRALHGLAHLRAGNHLRRVRRFAEREPAGGDPTDEHTHVGSMITRQHWEKVTGYIRLAEEGARVLAGGRNCPPACRRGWLAATSCVPRCWPTWTTACCAQEEIFGPVACLPFKDEVDGLTLANDVVRTGVLHLDPRYRPRASAGARHRGRHGVHQSQNVRDLRQPFGGTKESGTGRRRRIQLRGIRRGQNVCVSMGSHHIPRWGV